MEEVIQGVAEAHKDIRESLDQLSVEAGLASLVPTLEEYVGDFGKENGIQAQFEAPKGLLQLSPVAELQVLRITQEALANIRKHSGATDVWVKVTTPPSGVELVVKDNGQGFSFAESPADGQSHHGLKVMRERAESVGGTFAVNTSPGEGTEIKVGLPTGRGRF